MNRGMTTRKDDRPMGVRRRMEDPLENMLGLRDTINGIFEDFFSGRPMMASMLGMPSTEEQGWKPPVDISESGDEIMVCAMLPGVKKEDCSIEIQNDTLVLSGECKEPMENAENRVRHEIPCGKFYRAFNLPAQVKAEEIKATMKDGMLEIRLKKGDQQRSRRVDIQ